MRRDLALCRTALSTQASVARVGEQTTSGVVKEESKPTNNGIDTDVTMSGDSPKTSEHSPPRKPEEAEKEGQNQSSEDVADQSGQSQEPLQIEIPSGEHQGDNQTDTATGTYSNFDFESLFNDPSAHASPDIAPPSEPSKEASKVSSPAPEAPAPPTSAPVEQSQPKQPEADADINLVDAPVQDNNNNTNNTDDLFDFGDLTNFGESGGLNDDNDNISSLLPGLESYANAPTDPGQQQSQSGTDTFNIFDAAGAPDFGTTNETTNNAPTTTTTTTSTGDAEKKKAEGEQQQQQSQTQEQQQQQPETQDANAEEPRDDTFDALMNFDNFDMGSFGADDGDGGSTAFDASFFDI